jgi:hypothetical protein
MARLNAVMPAGIVMLDAKPVSFRVAARVRRAIYRVAPPCDARSTWVDDVSHAVQAFLASPSHVVERTRPAPKLLDIRPFVDCLAVHPNAVEVVLWITPYGAARPDEVFSALGLAPWLASGAVMERTDLELWDEIPADVAAHAVPVHTTNEQRPARPARPMPRQSVAQGTPTSLIDNPVTFDS